MDMLNKLSYTALIVKYLRLFIFFVTQITENYFYACIKKSLFP